MMPVSALPATLLVLALWSFRPGTVTQTCDEQLPPNSAEERAHDFGDVLQGDVVRHTFQIARPTPASVPGQVEVDQAGLTVRFRFPDPDGTSGALAVEWDTTRVKGAVEARLTVHWKDPGLAPLTLGLRGTVTPLVSIEPLPAAFFSVFAGETGHQTLTLVVNGAAPLSIGRVERQGTHFTVDLRTIEPGRRYELRLGVPNDASTGRFRERVVLHTDWPTRPTIAIPVNVLVKTDIYANPEDVDFGQVALAEVLRQPSMQPLLTQTFIVRRRQGPFTITRVTSDLPWLKIAQDPARGQSEAFRFEVSLDFATLSPGMKLEAELTVSTDDPRFPEIKLPVRGTVR